MPDPPPPIRRPDGEEYEVERILDERRRKGKKQYLVKWVGIPIVGRLMATRREPCECARSHSGVQSETGPHRPYDGDLAEIPEVANTNRSKHIRERTLSMFSLQGFFMVLARLLAALKHLMEECVVGPKADLW